MSVRSKKGTSDAIVTDALCHKLQAKDGKPRQLVQDETFLEMLAVQRESSQPLSLP
ncbi:MAG: hypothetical protein KME19_22425 [Microcoleus vaginatus WJT46-NPBG5]|jgi:hypothetical protein|nr:hypothetical protein [Microcoleus vaginatus WJT46-NPBG5]